MDNLIQPVLSSTPECGHNPNHVLSFRRFIDLLKLEEDYFEREQHNTKLMITRLRKIFYDKWGWNTQLIKKAACIKGRYKVDIVDCPENLENFIILKKVKRYVNDHYQPQCRSVTYRHNDRVYGNRRSRCVPEIYINDHQDVLLPEGYHCDMGHVLAGLDALNHLQTVSPIPTWLFFFRPFFPSADSNADVTTWLGDIATSAAAFVFWFLRHNKPPGPADEQELINCNASGSDMLGNIDAFVIHSLYNIQTSKDRRLSDIFLEYYSEDSTGKGHREKRFSIFCKIIGLKEWNGTTFSNEEEWMTYYTDQLRNTTSFMAFSFITSFPEKIQTPQRIWKGKYEEIIKARYLLEIFLNELKRLLK